MNLQFKSLRALAVELPGALEVLARHRIDFSFGRHDTLRDAARRKGLDPARLLEEIAALGAVPAAPLQPDLLIHHIIERYHETHRRELPEAIALAEQVELVHAGREDCPLGLADHLVVMNDELEAHHQREEAVLFPMMLRRDRELVSDHIRRVIQEHDDQRPLLERMASLAGNYATPWGACATWRRLYAACAKLDADLRIHAQLESQVLFPMFADI